MLFLSKNSKAVDKSKIKVIKKGSSSVPFSELVDH